MTTHQNDNEVNGEQTRVIGLIAGKGEIPLEIVRHCIATNSKICVVYIKNHASTESVDVPTIVLNIGQVGKAIKFFKQHKVTDIIMVGGVKRPKLTDLCLDLTGLRLLLKLSKSSLKGDNSQLTTIIKFLEEYGFKISGVDSVLAEIIMPKGNLTKKKPSKEILADIAIGIKVAKTIGDLDIGQSVVVQKGVVLAVEAIEGTDAMLKRVIDLKLQNQGGVLVKMKKPKQDFRVDLPTIGVATVQNVAKAGLAGIAIEAGSALIVKKEQVIKAAEEQGIFLLGV